jgi:hypothetical protein
MEAKNGRGRPWIFLLAPSLIVVAAFGLVAYIAMLGGQGSSFGGVEHLTEYSGDGFSFDYPISWRVISRYQHYGHDGPSVIVVVGTGGFDSGCTFTSTSVHCEQLKFNVGDNGVVLAYHVGPHGPSPVGPYPTPALGPSGSWVDVGGRAAILTRTATSFTWAFSAEPEYIEARFGNGVADEARSQIQALIASWRWDAFYRPP